MTLNGDNQATRSVEELFAYARSIEREAADQYTQLADMMWAHNNKELADLFRRMAELEWLHVYHLRDLCRDNNISESSIARSAGEGLRGIEAPSFEDMHYLHRPYQALKLAWKHEERAANLYNEFAKTTQKEDVRKWALSFAAEEESHMRELERWLSRYPEPEEGWDEDLDPPAEQ